MGWDTSSCKASDEKERGLPGFLLFLFESFSIKSREKKSTWTNINGDFPKCFLWFERGVFF